MIEKICNFCEKKFYVKHLIRSRPQCQKYCSRYCSQKAKWANEEMAAFMKANMRGKTKRAPPWNKGIPMSELTRKRVKRSLKRVGHTILEKNRGGNGRINRYQELLATVLSSQWKMEHAISLGGKRPGYPTCYKVDLALVKKKLAIEVDGATHYSIIAKSRDMKKTKALEKLGWKVLRISNAEVLKMFTTSRVTDRTRISSLTTV